MGNRTPDTGQGEQSAGGLLTAQQAAECVGLHERTIRRAIGRGELPATKQRGSFGIDVGALRAWFDRRSTATAPAPHPSSSPRTALPGHVPQEAHGPIIGREQELATATRMLCREDVRLLTLTGAGGIGKTRLALEVASRLREQFTDGVYVVLLAEVPDAGRVTATIAETLGLPDPGGADGRGALIAALRDARALLVLDNFEHVLEAAPLVSDLLTAGPHIKVMVTSRSLLRLRSEHALPVPPLALPDADTDTETREAAASPAVQLFMDRAQAISPSFALTSTNAPVVTNICHHLGGLPLAIELAASQVNLLSPDALLARIEANLPLPFRGPRDAPDRQRTMTNAIAWSYALLSPDEQRLFRRISVFVGGLPLDALDAMTGSAEIVPSLPEGGQRDALAEQLHAGDDPLGTLMTLVDSSLLQRDAQDDARYTMLEPIRAFALDQLAAQGKLDAAYDALADWSLDLAEGRALPAYPLGDERYFTRLDLEHANIRRSLAWLDEQRDVVRLLNLVVALGSFWYERNLYHEGRTWTERAVTLSANATTATTTTTPARGRALAQLGIFAGILGEPAAATGTVREGVSLLRQSDDTEALALAMIWQGAVAILAGDAVLAEQALHEALDLAPKIPDVSIGAAISARAMSNLGATAHARGDLAAALRWHTMALSTCRNHGYLRGTSRSLCDLGDVARDQEDYVASLTYYRECLMVLGERADLRTIIAALEGAAMAAASWKQGAQAARFLGAAERLGTRFGVPTFMSTDRTAHERTLRATRMVMDEGRFDELFAEGGRLTLAEAIAEVLALSPPSGSGYAQPTSSHPTLSPRELEVLHLLVRGLRDREIADTLFLSVRTVEGHVARILARLGVTSRTAAVSTAIDRGLAKPAPSPHE